MPLVVAIAYAVGLGLGWYATRGGAFADVWPIVVRTQMVAAPLLLTVAAVWRIETFGELFWPAVMVAAMIVQFAVTWLTQAEPQRMAHATLESMATSPNTGFFLLPIAAAIGGPGALVSAVLIDRMTIPLWGWWIALLRRGAPIPQSRRTGLVDQAALLSLVAGLLLRLTGPAPDWTATLALWTAPVLALSGAATFIGSALHPSQRIDPQPGRRRWWALVLLRIALFAAIAVVVPTASLRVLAILCALTVPTFSPPQWATVYGYANPVLAAGNRLGWFVGALGVVAAVALRP